MGNSAKKHSSSESEIFLRHLWPEQPEGSRLLIWSLDEKRSYWSETVTLAAVTASQVGQTENVYIGVGAAGDEYGPNQRCKSSKIIAIPGIAADFDVVNATRKKEDLFESRSEIHDFVASLPLAPSLMVESGGGLQAWWLWEEIWELDTQSDNRDAEAVARGWSRLMQSMAKKRGRAVDATWDLARIMRIPGTINHKYGRKVKLILDDGPRYNPGDFEIWREYRDEETVIEIGELALLEDASPPWDKFQALMELDPTFRLTWERRRKDLKDQSASSYGFSIAIQAALAEWTEQEIADLMISWRRKHGADLQLNRREWYHNEISRALGFQATQKTSLEVKAILDGAHETRSKAIGDDETSTTVPELENDDISKIIGLVRRVTGVPVDKILRYGGDDGQYSLVIKGGTEILIGPVLELMNWSSWQVIAMQHGRLSPRPKAQVWSDTLSGVQAILEIHEADDTTEQARVLLWLDDYLQGAVEMSGTDGLFSVLIIGDAFHEHGRSFFSLEKLLEWIQMTRKNRITAGRLRFRLVELGCKRKKISARSGGQVITKRYLSFTDGDKNE